MREGLRSGKLRVRPERDDILSEKKLEKEDTTNAVNLDGGKEHVLGAGDQEFVVPSGQGCGDVSEERPEVPKVMFGETESRELGKSDKWEVEQGQTLEDHCCYPKPTSRSIAKRVKADYLDGVVPFSGRVLRSMTIIGGRSGKMEREDDGILSIEVKKKRGRPPKTEKTEVNDNKKDQGMSAEFKKKIGRPPNKEIAPTEVKKRGRPPMIKNAEVGDNEKDEIISVEVKKKMREGLRSGKLRVRPERDDILSEMKLEEEDTTNAVNLDGGKEHVLGVGDQEVVVPSGQGCEDVSEERPEVPKVKFGETESRELGKSDKWEAERGHTLGDHCCYPKTTSRSIAKRVKADHLDGVVPFSGRVLRSMTIIGGWSGKREREDDGILSIEVKKKRGRPPKTEKAEVDDNEKDEVISAEFKKIGRPPNKEIAPIEVKKRGRPPMIKKAEVDDNDDNEKDEIISVEVRKKKREQPPKIKKVEVGENEEDEIISTEFRKWEQTTKIRKAEFDKHKKDKQLRDEQLLQKLRKKRGRPSKLESFMNEGEKGSLSSTNQLKKRGRPHKSRTRPPEEGKPAVMLAKSPHTVGNILGSRGNCRILRVKKSWKKLVGRALRRGKREKSGNPKRHKINKKKCDALLENWECKRKGNIAEGSRREEKQIVRDKIMRLIMEAGWTVQYRPREGRTYQDAVYVSPDGKTCWSITLAYKVLKRHYEEGDGKSAVNTQGFVFTPISDEELGILARITNKKRLKRKKIPERNSLGGPICAKVSLHGESLLPSGNRRRPETENNKRRGLLVRKAGENESGEEDYVLYKGKRTVLAWMIDMGVVPDNGAVLYRQRKTSQADLNGWVTKDGIRCSCCDEVITITEFEAHAGHESRNMALQNILLDNGKSLLQCELTTWNKQEELLKKGFYTIDTNCDDPNDDTCGICGDGGNLVCCESCPSTFHLCCLGITKSPSGDWHCPYCSCKYCGMVAVGTGERSNDGDAAISALKKCLLCEDRFHRLCVFEEDTVEDAWASRSFCGKKCLKLHKDIEGLLGVEHKLEEGYSCTLVRRSDIDFGVTTFDELSRKVHGNSKVAVALSIMNECFLPVDDRRSGINIIQNIMYNCGLNFSGFYTAILEKGDEMICVASVRIHGNLLAEMPFIGTRYMFRRQGMCRRLLTALESILCTLKIEKLIIPAIDELKETWTSIFGFEPARGELRTRMRNMNILAFPGIDMLQKQLSIPPALVENVISPEGPLSIQSKDVNKDGSDITSGNVQLSDSENGKNQITQLYEPSDAKEKCSNIRNPIPNKHECSPDLSSCLNLEAPGADMEFKEKPSVDVKIIPCSEPRFLDIADKETLDVSLSNEGGLQNITCDQRTESPFPRQFSENILDGEEGLVLGNGSLSPGVAFHDAEEEFLSVIESPLHQTGELLSSRSEAEDPLRHVTASNGPFNHAPSATHHHHSDIFPLHDCYPVLPVDSNQEPSAAEGTNGYHYGAFRGHVLDGKQGMAPPVNGSSSLDELFYDAKEGTLAVSASSPHAD